MSLASRQNDARVGHTRGHRSWTSVYESRHHSPRGTLPPPWFLTERDGGTTDRGQRGVSGHDRCTPPPSFRTFRPRTWTLGLHLVPPFRPRVSHGLSTLRRSTSPRTGPGFQSPWHNPVSGVEAIRNFLYKVGFDGEGI